MKIMNKLLASASALAICLSSSLGATETNQWFKVDFEGAPYVVGESVAGKATWTKSGTSDASIVLDIDAGTPATKGSASNNIVKLDTQGDELIWTPAPQTGNRVLLDTAVYLVGSDDEPGISDGNVQTEVYLSTAGTTTNLQAHVGNGSGGSVWVALSSANVTITDKSWVQLRIEINYDATPNQVSFYVNGYRMTSGDDNFWPVMPSGAAATTVNSVSFKGTGYIDNFVGKTVDITADGPTFNPPQVDTDGESAVAGGTINTSTPGKVIATFADTLLGGETLQYVQLTGSNGYVRTYRTSNGAEVEFNTTGLASGNYDVTAYYGDAPSVVPVGYKPAAEAGGAKPAAEVVEVGEAKFLRVNVKPVSGLYYTLFVGTDGALPADLSAAAASVLAYPDDQDGETLVIDLPVPTDPNGVNLIKIYASDEAYDAEDPAPVE